MDWWKVSVLPFSVVVDEAWNGKCSRYEVFLYPSHIRCTVGEATHVAGAP